MEIILRVSTAGNFFSSGLIFSLMFLIPFAIIFYVLCSLFEGTLSYIFSLVLLGLSALVFSSQLIYYKLFRVFYILYSVGNAAQIFEFWKDICTLLVKNFLWIVLFFSPVILIIAFGKKILSFEKIDRHLRFLLVLCIVLSHLISVSAVCVSSKEKYSAYDLYYKDNYPILSVEKLGLITTMRLDLQRLLSGWSPAIESSSLDVPAFSKDIIYKDTIEEVNIKEDTIEEGNIEEKKVEYNTMNIDFTRLISDEKNEVIKDMHKYFERVQPTSKNEHTGIYEGYNLIFITAEAFSPYAVHADVTPTLYKLVHQGYNFTNFYNPLWEVSTSDGEYVACTGLIPKKGIWSFQKSGSIYMPFTMGTQLRKLNYRTVAYHNHTYSYYKRNISHPNMGYDYKGVGNGLILKKTWPASDLEMMQKTVPEYISSQPFHAYYMTVSGHLQYNFSGNAMALKNRALVQSLPYSEPCKAYIATQIELDIALQHLLNQLEETGIADKTLIALSADHYPYGLEDKYINELAGHSVEKNFELYKSNLILYTNGMEPVTIDRPCSSLDIIPTLSNLLGLEYDSRLLMGRDIFSDSEPLVIFLNKSFITDKGRYNSTTGEFTPSEGVTIDKDYIDYISAIVASKFHYSSKILETDYYSKVLTVKN